MTEYITKEQAIDEVWDAFMSHDDPDLGRVIEENIKRLPAADVVEVVRCKDCEYSRKDGIFLWCDRWKHGTNPEGEGWCNLGEKKRGKYCPHCGTRMEGEEK